MDIARQTSAARINEIANHASVYEWIRGDMKGYIDLSLAIADTRNVALVGEHGGMVFGQHQPGLYEAHTAVLPEGRGAWAVSMAKACQRYMFTKTDALEIFTLTPQGNIGALALTRMVKGGKYITKLEKRWTMDDKPVPASIYSITVQDWIANCPELTETANQFHHNAGTAPGSPLDIAHVGASIEMLKGGQPQKAIVFYNRWAAMANKEPMEIVTISPLAVKIGSILMMVRDSEYWIIKCR